MLCVGREKALVIAGNATLTEKSRGTRETPSPITKTAKLLVIPLGESLKISPSPASSKLSVHLAD